MGLTSASCLATKCDVLGFDTNAKKIEEVKLGKAPFFEPRLDDILDKVIKKGAFQTTSSYVDAVLGSNVTFICVDTPTDASGSSNLGYVESAASMIAESLEMKSSWHLVVVKSTVPPGTTSQIVKSILERGSKRLGVDFGLCMNPEFLREGSAVEDMLNPDRIIIGEADKKSGDNLEQLFREFYGEKLPPILRENLENAELIKYTNNAFLATKVSFANMIANLCEQIPGADVTHVMKGIGYDKRIGSQFLSAGVGWGGSCLPKDTRALVSTSKKLGCDLMLVRDAITINDERPRHMVKLAEEAVGGLNGKCVSLLGLSFKPKTDDIRNAPSLSIIKSLLELNARVSVYDPVAMENVQRIFGDKLTYCKTAFECLERSECCMLVTEWDEFKLLTPDDFLKRMNTPVLIDGRRIYDLKSFEHKIELRAIGLGQSRDAVK